MLLLRLEFYEVGQLVNNAMDGLLDSGMGCGDLHLKWPPTCCWWRGSAPCHNLGATARGAS